MDPSPVDDILLLDEQRRQLIQDVEEMRAERNLVSKRFQNKDQVQRKEKIEAMRHLGDQIDETGNRLKWLRKLNTLFQSCLTSLILMSPWCG